MTDVQCYKEDMKAYEGEHVNDFREKAVSHFPATINTHRPSNSPASILLSLFPHGCLDDICSSQFGCLFKLGDGLVTGFVL